MRVEGEGPLLRCQNAAAALFRLLAAQQACLDLQLLVLLAAGAGAPGADTLTHC
jgi:hypothetical protein